MLVTCPPGHGRTKLGYSRTCRRPGGDVSIRWEASRAAECLERPVQTGFTGVVQCNGHQSCQRLATGRGGKVTLAGCLVHVRRKCYEARVQAP